MATGVTRQGTLIGEILLGDAGDDSLHGCGGADILRGYDGDDMLDSNFRWDAVANRWLPDDQGDTLDGGNGNDTLYGGAADDILLGGAGDDKLYGYGGKDSLLGGDGNDVLQSGRTYDPNTRKFGTDLFGDTLDGGNGNDQLAGDIADDKLLGGAGDDTLSGGGGKDVLLGGDGNDRLQSGLRNDPNVTNGASIDLVGDTLDGGAGNDIVNGGASDDLLLGGIGDDTLNGGGGKDALKGGDGNDILQSGLRFNPATQKFDADLAGDTLDGGNGNDELYGSDNADLLLGGAGDDKLYGGKGNDTLDGGTGSNLLDGGLGDDTYAVRSVLDRIQDAGGNDKGVIYVDWYRPTGNVEQWTWAAGVQKLPDWIAALAAGTPETRVSGVTKTIYYSFAAAPASFFTAADKNGFTPFNAAQRAFARQVFDYVSTVANVEFRESSNPNGNGVLVLGNNTQQSSSAGYTGTYGATDNKAILLNKSVAENLAPTTSNQGVKILLHEIGHALGLKHPFSHADAGGKVDEGPFLGSYEDAGRFTLMSYNTTASDHKLSYSPLDIAALQYLYGPAAKLAGGSNVWKLDAGKANLIADGGGYDMLDGSALGVAMRIDLRPGYWGYIGTKADSIVKAGQVTVDFGTVIENARGGRSHDMLTGNDIANRLQGDAGNDVLIGNGGVDIAVYTGIAAGYKLTYAAGLVTVQDTDATNGNEGTDTLKTVEVLDFTDRDLNLATFDANWFMAKYSDVRQLVGTNVEAATKYYVETAFKAGRSVVTGGNDTLNGSADADLISGYAGNDFLNGQAGNDTLNGGAGTDTLMGGAGADKFVFDGLLAGGGIDLVADFVAGVDKIVLDDDIFTAFDAGRSAAVTATAFVLGAAAGDADDRIAYDKTSGKLFYDADGSGAGAGIQIALLGNKTHPVLSAGDFLIVA